MSTLVTGSAGFIGFHLTQRLLDEGRAVLGLDNLNDYYDVSLKKARLTQLTDRSGFRFKKIDVADRTAVQHLFEEEDIDRVVHLAAQAGVRYSLENPHAYIDSNLVGFTNILEGCRHAEVGHLLFASSSSVYGGNEKLPFGEEDRVDHPVSLYAATKKSNELLAHSYAHLYDLPVTGLRFFTVYGPWGRPDMALFIFVKAILEGRPIDVFGHGDMERDFTYVDDIVEGVTRVMERPPAEKKAPYRIYNIGNNAPVPLMKFIEAIEETVGREAEKNFLPMQPGDVRATYADASRLMDDVGFRPSTPVREGVTRFVEWYRDYYGEGAGSKEAGAEGAGEEASAERATGVRPA